MVQLIFRTNDLTVLKTIYSLYKKLNLGVKCDCLDVNRRGLSFHLHSYKYTRF